MTIKLFSGSTSRLIMATGVSISLALLSGCSSKQVVSYGDANAVETTDINFGSTDLQKVANEMTDSLISSPIIGSLTQNKRPVVFVERIKNKTSEHIDTESITDSISTKVLRSGKFRFVDMSRVESVKQQLQFQQEGGLVDPSKAS